MLEKIKHQPLLTVFLVLASGAAGIYVFQFVWSFLLFFSDIIIILVCAWVLNFILGPFVETLHQRVKLPRIWAASIVYALFFSILISSILLFIPAVTSQTQTLLKVLPKYQASFPQYVSRITGAFFAVVDNALTLLPSIAGVFFDVFLIVVTSFYFVLDKDRFTRELYSLLPKRWHSHADYVRELIDNTFGSFIRMQLLLGIIAGVATWIIMSAFGLQFAASTSLIAGLLTIVPLIGGLLALIPPFVIAFLVDPAKALLVLLVLIAMQQIVINIVGPRIMGKALQLHPVIVLLSFLIGYKVAGGFGVIFAVPVLGILFVIFHRLGHHFLDEI